LQLASRSELTRLEIEDSYFLDALDFFEDPLKERPKLNQLTPVKLQDIDFQLKYRLGDPPIFPAANLLEEKQDSGFLLQSNQSIIY